MKYTECLNDSCFFTDTPKEHCVVHHVFNGNPNRKLSEKYGMKIYVHPNWHNFTPYSIHMNEENDLIVKRYAQERFNELFPNLDFVSIFGKNYL